MNLKNRIAGAETAAATEESPLAALFRNAKPLGTEPDPSNQAEPQPPRLLELPVDALDEMEQPFRLYSEAKMENMRQSISLHGMIQRIVVRPYPAGSGHYQIISGRNRRRAAMLAGYTMVPCEVRVLDDDEARLQMVAANLEQREELLPSEKAWAYRIQLETLTHQGKRTSPQTAAKLRSDDRLGEEVGISGDTIQRFIRLTYLLSELLEAVDNGTLGCGAAVALSYLTLENQTAVYQYFFLQQKQKISGSLAETLRDAGEKAALTPERLEMILAPAVPPRKFRKVSVPMKPLRSFFPPEATSKEVEKRIVEIVKQYFRTGGGNGAGM